MASKNLENIGVGEQEWYAKAEASRASWTAAYRLGKEIYRAAQAREASDTAKAVVCDVCFRAFKRMGDKKRHKCVCERRKPVSEHLWSSPVSVLPEIV